MNDPIWFWPLMIVCIGGLVTVGLGLYYEFTKPKRPLPTMSIIFGMFDDITVKSFTG